MPHKLSCDQGAAEGNSRYRKAGTAEWLVSACNGRKPGWRFREIDCMRQLDRKGMWGLPCVDFEGVPDEYDTGRDP